MCLAFSGVLISSLYCWIQCFHPPQLATIQLHPSVPPQHIWQHSKYWCIGPASWWVHHVLFQHHLISRTLHTTAKCKGKVELGEHPALQEGGETPVSDWVWENNQYFGGICSVFKGLERRVESRLNCTGPEAVLSHWMYCQCLCVTENLSGCEDRCEKCWRTGPAHLSAEQHVLSCRWTDNEMP